MKISIIITSYNCGGKLLRECVDSCISNCSSLPMNEYEILIGDDGSEDDSISAIINLKKEYPGIIDYFVMERSIEEDFIPSVRVSNLIKKGLELSSGEYIQLISADDLLIDSSKIKRSIFFLDNNPRYASCHTDFSMFWNDGKVVVPKTNFHNFSRSSLWVNSYKHISCYIFRKNVCNHLLETFCDDSGMFFSCFITGKTKYIGGLSFGYRQRSTSIVNSTSQLSSHILDVLVIEETISTKKFLFASFAKLFTPTVYILKHKEELKGSKFKKYLIQEKQGIITYISKYDSKKARNIVFYSFVICCFLLKIYFFVKCKLEVLLK